MAEGGKKPHVLTPQVACVLNAILEESVDQLQLLALIAKNAKNRGHQKRSKTDMHTLLLRRSELEKKYEELMLRRSSLKGLHNKKKYDKNQKAIKELSEALRESIKTISTNLSESNNPNLSRNLMKVEKDRYMLESLLRITIKELKTERTFSTLKTQVNTQLDDLQNLETTKKKRAEIHHHVKTIESHLKRERELFEKNVKSREDEIARLTRRLQSLKVETNMTLDYEKASAEAAERTHKRMIRKKLAAVDAEIAEYEMKIERDAKVHDSTMKFLIDRQNEMKAKLESWTSKYKADIKEAQNKLDDLNEIRDYDKSKLDALRARKEKDEIEKKMILERQKQKAEALKLRREEEKRMFTAASKIRFYWNVFWRKEGAKASKGKGKKKKGKKK